MGRGHDHNKFCSVEQIPFADEITWGIEKFAADNDLAFDSYYHDLPVWVVHEHEIKEKTRRLQLTAYLVSDALFLSLVPSVHISVDAGTILVPKKVDAERFPLMQILGENEEFDQNMLSEKLSVAWDRTALLTFAPEQLIRVQLPKTIVAARPGSAQANASLKSSLC